MSSEARVPNIPQILIIIAIIKNNASQQPILKESCEDFVLRSSLLILT